MRKKSLGLNFENVHFTKVKNNCKNTTKFFFFPTKYAQHAIFVRGVKKKTHKPTRYENKKIIGNEKCEFFRYVCTRV